MTNQIKCPYCDKSFEPTDAYKHELEEKLREEARLRYQEEINLLKNKQQEDELAKQVEIQEIKKKALIDASKIAKEQNTKEIQDKDDQIFSLKKRAEDAETKELEIRKEKRELEESKRKFELEKQRQIDEEREKIRQEAIKQANETHGLKDKEKDLMIEGLKKAVADAQRKAEQGSQQLQGEAQEIVLEEQLARTFVYDGISEVPKGINGADVIQIVKTNFGITCGTIVWESKNTKAWSQQWVLKLKEDARTLKANVSVLVSSVLPEGIQSFGQIDGIWVCDIKSSIPLALALREKIIAVKSAQEASKGKTTKAEIVYDYLISNDFKQRIEVWIEYFNSRKEELDIEKRYFMKKWEKEEKNITRIVNNTAGMYGDLQSYIGSALPKVQYLELPEP